MSILKANSSKRLSLFAFLFIALVFVFVKIRQVRSVEPFIRESYSLSWDNYGYYLHLPAAIIYRDIGIANRSWLDTLNNKYQKDRPFYQVWPGQKNRLVNVYPVGFAVFNLPFFLVGHISAKIFGYKADGLSPPYQWSMIFSALFFAIMGFWVLRKLLIRYFNDGLTAFLILLIGFGTNLYYYATYECMLPHIYLFAADTLLILLTIRWHESPNRKTALYIGMLLGLITITRPSEIVWILIPLFWNVSGWNSLKEKISLLKRHAVHVLILIFGMVAVGSLQLFYWKYTSGNWFSFNHSEGFDFFNPFTLKVLFSYKKGWLLYTPMMMLAISGFVVLFRKDRKLFVPTLLFFLANLWFISSWECWWYAGSFGQRPFVSSYGLMAIPLGYVVSSLQTPRLLWRKGLALLAGLFLLLNQFQTWQYKNDIINHELMTKDYYWKIFGKTSVQSQWNSLLEIDRGNLPPFDQVKENYLGTSFVLIADDSTKKIRLDNSNVYGAGFKKTFDELTKKDHLRIHFSVDVMATTNLVDHPFNLVFTMIGNREQAYGYSSVQFDTTIVKPDQWTSVSADFVTPEILHESDEVNVNVWNNGGSLIFIKNAKLVFYEPIR